MTNHKMEPCHDRIGDLERSRLEQAPEPRRQPLMDRPDDPPKESDDPREVIDYSRIRREMADTAHDLVTIRPHRHALSIVADRLPLRASGWGDRPAPYSRACQSSKTAGADHRGKRLWRCLFLCENERVTTADKLREGRVKSYGCIRRDRTRNTSTATDERSDEAGR